jgi:hypothetical protein
MVAHIQAGQPIPADLAAWFEGGVRRFNRSDTDRPLCDELGLNRRPFDRQRAYCERNRQLQTAARHVAAEATSDWARACRLADAVATFADEDWPRWCHWHEPPDHISRLRASLFYAFCAGVDIPRSAKQLLEIIRY